MSNVQKITASAIIDKTKPRFNQLNVVNNVAFEQESSFAKQLIANNDFLEKTAMANQSSLMAAIINIASVGLSLNPARKHAYLVPRDNKVCLDISYLGMVKLATDCGAIEWAKAELVYEADKFELNGITQEPNHTRDPFCKERGIMVGAYCVAKLHSGDFMTTAMDIVEIQKIRQASKGAHSKYSPWNTYFEEMAKKTVIKRASKSWPQTENRERWDNAIQILNEHEGLSYTVEQQKQFSYLLEKAANEPEDESGYSCEFFMFSKVVGEESYTSLFNSGEKGKKVDIKNKARQATSKGSKAFNDMIIDIKGSIANGEGVEDYAADYAGYAEFICEHLTPEEAQEFK